MNIQVKFLIALFALIGIPFLSEKSLAQGGSVPPSGCSALDKSKPPLFISFESLTDKAWAGDKYEKGVLLRLNNNSKCMISFSASIGAVSGIRPNFVIRDGKLIRQSDARLGSLINGQRVSLEYVMKYPNQKYMVIGGYGGDVLQTVYLNGEDHVFFGVPLKNFQKGGELRIAYNYEWDEGEASQIMTKKGDYIQRYETVEHYLRFVPQQLPENIIR
jgi:hypothetical protein